MAHGNLRAMVWIFLILVLVGILIYILSEHRMQVRSRNQQLDQIQRRLAEKKAESDGDQTDEP